MPRPVSLPSFPSPPCRPPFDSLPFFSKALPKVPFCSPFSALSCARLSVRLYARTYISIHGVCVYSFGSFILLGLSDYYLLVLPFCFFFSLSLSVSLSICIYPCLPVGPSSSRHGLYMIAKVKSVGCYEWMHELQRTLKTILHYVCLCVGIKSRTPAAGGKALDGNPKEQSYV